MNYIYKCPICHHEHPINVHMAKGNVIDIDSIPDNCHECGETFNQDKIEEDIYDVASSYNENRRAGKWKDNI